MWRSWRPAYLWPKRSRPHFRQSSCNSAQLPTACSASSRPPLNVALRSNTQSLSAAGRRSLRLYSIEKDTRAGTSSIYMECDSRSPLGSVAQRVSEVARGNLLRQKSRDIVHQRHFRVHVGIEVGAV